MGTRGVLDSNGNGYGINVHDKIYPDCLSLVAIVMAFPTGDAARSAVIPDGMGAFAGTSYYDFVIDMLDSLYGAQAPNGGWHYNARADQRNTDADGSTHQWPNIAMTAAKERWGVIPLPAVLAGSMSAFEGLQNASGGCGYGSSSSWLNLAKTGGMLGGYKLGGRGVGEDHVDRGIQYLGNNWNNDPSESDDGGGWAGDFYAIYGVKKGLQLQGVTTLTTPTGQRDWYQDLSGWLLGDATLLDPATAPSVRDSSHGFGQNSDGHWDGSGDGGFVTDSYLCTPSAVLVLTKAVTKPLPVGVIAAVPAQSSVHPAAFTLDASGSYHMDPNSSIVEYLWSTNATPDWSHPFASGKTVSVNPGWTVPGTYTVTLRVGDNNNPENFATASTTVTVQDTAVPPVAVPIPVAHQPAIYAAKIGDTILLDGSESYDPDGFPITAYAWDLNGDGIYGGVADGLLDTSGHGATGVTASVTYGTSYNGQISLQVTANGLSSANNTAIDVYASPSDLYVSSISASAIVPGVSATIHAVVNNDATSGQGFPTVLVKFYDGNPFTTGAQIGTNCVVNLPIGGSATIDTTLPIGAATAVYVYVDANNAIVEFNETNNTASVNVLAVNHAPVAVADSYSVNEDAVLTITAPGVLANDTDADSDPLTAVLVAGPSQGVLSLNADGSLG